jgi:hypothetical protein
MPCHRPFGRYAAERGPTSAHFEVVDPDPETKLQTTNFAEMQARIPIFYPPPCAAVVPEQPSS